MAENDTMDVDEPQPTGKGKKESKDSNKARFEVKKVSVLLTAMKKVIVYLIGIVERCSALGVG